jgi:hypothetical protein
MQAYTDILVAPVQALFAGFHGGPVHQAGPLYPDFDQQGRARHWRGTARWTSARSPGRRRAHRSPGR